MGTINVWFLGIVTHVFRESTQPTAPPVRKTVCVSWPIENELPYGTDVVTVPAHIPYLSVAAGDILGEVPPFFPLPIDGIYRWGMGGVSLQILNVKEGLITGSSWPEIASLSALTPEIGPIRPEVVLEQNPAYSAMQFDTTGGTFAAFKTPKNAVVAILGAETTDIGDDPVLLSIQPYGARATSLALRSGATVTIANDGVDEDYPTDFLLHYLTVRPYPPDPGIPPIDLIIENLPVATPDVTWPPTFTVGPGCSNSTYP